MKIVKILSLKVAIATVSIAFFALVSFSFSISENLNPKSETPPLCGGRVSNRGYVYIGGYNARVTAGFNSLSTVTYWDLPVGAFNINSNSNSVTFSIDTGIFCTQNGTCPKANLLITAHYLCEDGTTGESTGCVTILVP